MLIQPFLTYYRDNPDYNESDRSIEFASMLQRNAAVQDFLDGNIDDEHLIDLLESHNIDPQTYIETVEAEIDYLIANPSMLYESTYC